MWRWTYFLHDTSSFHARCSQAHMVPLSACTASATHGVDNTLPSFLNGMTDTLDLRLKNILKLTNHI